MTMATRPRCLERATALHTCWQKTSAVRPAATRPSNPVQQAKTVDFALIPRCFDQALPAPSFSRPDAREGRVKGNLHLILEREISTRQKREYVFQVGGKLIPQVSLNQIVNG